MLDDRRISLLLRRAYDQVLTSNLSTAAASTAAHVDPSKQYTGLLDGIDIVADPFAEAVGSKPVDIGASPVLNGTIAAQRGLHPRPSSSSSSLIELIDSAVSGKRRRGVARLDGSAPRPGGKKKLHEMVQALEKARTAGQQAVAFRELMESTDPTPYFSAYGISAMGLFARTALSLEEAGLLRGVLLQSHPRNVTGFIRRLQNAPWAASIGVDRCASLVLNHLMDCLLGHASQAQLSATAVGDASASIRQSRSNEELECDRRQQARKRPHSSATAVAATSASAASNVSTPMLLQLHLWSPYATDSLLVALKFGDRLNAPAVQLVTQLLTWFLDSSGANFGADPSHLKYAVYSTLRLRHSLERIGCTQPLVPRLHAALEKAILPAINTGSKSLTRNPARLASVAVLLHEAKANGYTGFHRLRAAVALAVSVRDLEQLDSTALVYLAVGTGALQPANRFRHYYHSLLCTTINRCKGLRVMNASGNFTGAGASATSSASNDGIAAEALSAVGRPDTVATAVEEEVKSASSSDALPAISNRNSSSRLHEPLSLQQLVTIMHVTACGGHIYTCPAAFDWLQKHMHTLLYQSGITHKMERVLELAAGVVAEANGSTAVGISGLNPSLSSVEPSDREHRPFKMHGEGAQALSLRSALGKKWVRGDADLILSLSRAGSDVRLLEPSSGATATVSGETVVVDAGAFAAAALLAARPVGILPPISHPCWEVMRNSVLTSGDVPSMLLEIEHKVKGYNFLVKSGNLDGATSPVDGGSPDISAGSTEPGDDEGRAEFLELHPSLQAAYQDSLAEEWQQLESAVQADGSKSPPSASSGTSSPDQPSFTGPVHSLGLIVRRALAASLLAQTDASRAALAQALASVAPIAEPSFAGASAAVSIAVPWIPTSEAQSPLMSSSVPSWQHAGATSFGLWTLVARAVLEHCASSNLPLPLIDYPTTTGAVLHFAWPEVRFGLHMESLRDYPALAHNDVTLAAALTHAAAEDTLSSSSSSDLSMALSPALGGRQPTVTMLPQGPAALLQLLARNRAGGAAQADDVMAEQKRNHELRAYFYKPQRLSERLQALRRIGYDHIATVNVLDLLKIASASGLPLEQLVLAGGPYAPPSIASLKARAVTVTADEADAPTMGADSSDEMKPHRRPPPPLLPLPLHALTGMLRAAREVVAERLGSPSVVERLSRLREEMTKQAQAQQQGQLLKGKSARAASLQKKAQTTSSAN